MPKLCQCGKEKILESMKDHGEVGYEGYSEYAAKMLIEELESDCVCDEKEEDNCPM